MVNKLTFEEAYSLVMQHIKARKWDKTNSSRGLAISLSLEANELLEYFQWHDESCGITEDMASELADIMIYAIQFADRYGMDILSAIKQKIEKQDKNTLLRFLKSRTRKSATSGGLKRRRITRKILHFSYLNCHSQLSVGRATGLCVKHICLTYVPN